MANVFRSKCPTNRMLRRQTHIPKVKSLSQFRSTTEDLKMADFLSKQNKNKTSMEEEASSNDYSHKNSVTSIADEEQLRMTGENCAESCADSMTVWSPPNTPPNKITFPSFPSLSPYAPKQLDEIRSKYTKITPPRGRPKAEMINYLIVEGAQSCSPIRCDICSRVFPREKSLQAHKRTHSGDRPYTCDFPNCEKAFVQSGQLKTHQRLHTGEKPFVCAVPNCNSRFTHANRHCPTHPKAGLLRQDCEIIPLKRSLLSEIQNKEPNEQTKNVLKWLDKYEREKQDKSPTLKIKKEKQEKGRRCLKSVKNQLSERNKSRVEAKQRLTEQKERWFGALALVELAEITSKTLPVHKSLNFRIPRNENHVELL